MAFSYTYGTYYTWSGYQFKFRSFLAYEVTTNNDTTYTIKLNGGSQVDLNNEIGVNNQKVVIATSNSSQTAKTNSDLDYRNPSKTDSSRRQTAFSDFTWTWQKGQSAQTFNITCTLSSSSMTTSTATYSVTVPAKPSYTVTYNANGGSGAPTSQTKWYNETLTLSSTKPTRTGYTFVKWNTNSSGSGTNYNPGGSYTGNAALTLYAVWQLNTYAVTYNANGGVGSIANQTKTYGVNLTLSNGAGFTKSLYDLEKWNTAANGSGTDYALGATYSGNAALSLYAIWKLAYTLPVISNFKCYRVATPGSTTETDDGQYIYISFDWVGGSIDGGVTEIQPTCVITIDGTQKYNATLSATPFSADYGTYSKDTAHSVSVQLYDSTYPTGVTVTETIATATYALDLLALGIDVYIGVHHPAISGQDVTLPSTYVDGNLFVALDTTAASGTTDGDLYAALVTLGWASDVIV